MYCPVATRVIYFGSQCNALFDVNALYYVCNALTVFQECGIFFVVRNVNAVDLNWTHSVVSS